METILVTGGAGFIGSHLVAGGIRRAFHVRVLDNLEAGTVGRLAAALRLSPKGIPAPGDREAAGGRDAVAGAARIRMTPQCELLIGDIRDPAVCAEACAGVSVVFHEAAQRSVPRSVDAPVEATDVNIMGTLRLLLAARDAGVRRVVYASSSSVYGDNPDLPKRETQMPAPLSPYAASKLGGELYCRVFARLYGLPTISLRYFNVFGPRQDPLSQYAAAIPKFITAIRAGEPVTVHGDGEQSRDFTYVDDVVTANFLAMDASAGSGEAFNIGGGKRITILEVVDAIGRILGRSPTIVHTPPRPGDVRHTLADLSAADAALGYRPEFPFAEGLRRTVASFEE